MTRPAFYVDGALFRTVNTPTDLSRTGARAHAWDTIYDFGGPQANVALAAADIHGCAGPPQPTLRPGARVAEPFASKQGEGGPMIGGGAPTWGALNERPQVMPEGA
ncbi:MAG TPA: hypothetical protein VK585_14160 [Jiangellaceae bacterium]|nr:hypothetical protein [Jiangellaceae bacterium]